MKYVGFGRHPVRKIAATFYIAATLATHFEFKGLSRLSRRRSPCSPARLGENLRADVILAVCGRRLD
jgi:hypothetical protein